MDRILLVLVFPWGKFLFVVFYGVLVRSVAIQFGFRYPLPVLNGLRAVLPGPQKQAPLEESGVLESGSLGQPPALSSALSRPAAHTLNLFPLWPSSPLRT